ncbi:GNAT family N-acetyltransferase [Pontibacillus halophilus]|uniref:GNAT family N-acetyltransferase n=1 Tax=Pontibacillus halophilus TaxID=516704 RepID=UPI0018CDDB96|nr:GNAT family N-acetyltransferase [Pontibacillus halophilus]
MQDKNGSLYTLRSAHPKDGKDVLNFTKTMLQEADYLITKPTEYLVPLRREKRMIKQFMYARGRLFLLLFHETRLVGMLDLMNSSRKRLSHVADIGMSIDSAYQNLGLGRLLLQHARAWAEAHPTIEKLALEVFKQNEQAIHLYTSLGFVQEGEKKQAVKLEDGTYDSLIQMGRSVLKGGRLDE